jgi:predicted ATP-grasp superfamily ATP-dependent carboligase
MQVLLTDGQTRKAFDIFNLLSLHFDPLKIILSVDNDSKWKNRLIYKKKSVRLRKKSEREFADDLLQISNSFSNEIIIFIPVEEDSISLFFSFTKEYGSLNFKYLLPSEESFNLVRDKYLLNIYCLQNDIPAPVIFEKDDLILMNKDNFIPLIMKPRIGSGSKGIIHIDDFSKLSVLANYQLKNFVIQEKLENGRDVKGAFFLCNNGDVVSSYCHERIRTFPIDGGVSVFSKISVNKDILEIGSKLIKKLNWSGFVMIEFLHDKKLNTFKVIEINPRIWGSILLSEISKANFIKNYVQLSKNESLIYSEINYNAKIRWMPFDLLNLIYSKGKIENFWKIDKKNTCYINCTYANWWSIIWFHLFFYINFKNFVTFMLKWKR